MDHTSNTLISSFESKDVLANIPIVCDFLMSLSLFHGFRRRGKLSSILILSLVLILSVVLPRGCLLRKMRNSSNNYLSWKPSILFVLAHLLETLPLSFLRSQMVLVGFALIIASLTSSLSRIGTHYLGSTICSIN